MTEKISVILPIATKKSFSEQEKRDYYKAWESSGMSKRDFCKAHGLPVDSLYDWHKLFKKKSASKSKQFSPVVAKATPANHQAPMTQLEMRLPNQLQLFIPLHESHLVTFIQELCNAVTVIR